MAYKNNLFKLLEGDARYFGALVFPHKIRSSAALAASWAGYSMMEGSIQNLDDDWMIHSETIHDYVMALPDSIREPLQYQGSDVASAYFHTVFYGAIALTAAKMVVDQLPPTKAANFMKKHPVALRDTIGFSALVGYEMLQADIQDKPVDLQDIAAYGAGILLLGYGHKIARGFRDGVKDVCTYLRQPFMTPQEKLERRLQL